MVLYTVRLFVMPKKVKEVQYSKWTVDSLCVMKLDLHINI